MGLIRILVVDDHALMRSSICRLVSQQSDMEVIGEAGTGTEAILAAELHKPDVVLLDISLPELNGLRALPRILQVAPHTRVLMVSNHEEPSFIRESTRAGAHGFLGKTHLTTSLVGAIHKVLEPAPPLMNRKDRGPEAGPPRSVGTAEA